MENMFVLLTAQSNAIAIDWSEIIYIIIGAIIGLFASLTTIVIERILDNKGKLNIFYRRICPPGANGRELHFANTEECTFLLPIAFEIQNTSNRSRVIRDVGILLYSGNKLIGKMRQIKKLSIDNSNTAGVAEKQIHHFGSEKGSYSFVLSPRSIQTQICNYIFSANLSEKEQKSFDTVVLRYYDEKNKAHTFKLMNICNCWEPKWGDIDDYWCLLTDKIRIKEQ